MYPIKSLPLATALFVISVGHVSASTLTPTVDFINANVNVNGSSSGSGDQPVAFATATDTETVTFNGGSVVDTVTGTAIQNENGFSSLELTVESNGDQGYASTGVSGTVNNKATAIRQITFTNDTLLATVGTFSFNLSGIELEAYRAGGSPTASEASVAFAVGTSRGATYNADITFTGTFPANGPEYEITSANKFFASSIVRQCDFGFCISAKANVDALSGSVTLGVLAPGESVSVTTTFDIETSFDRFENGASARAVDPGTYSWSFKPQDPNGPTVVPLPAGAWLLLTGLGAVGALRRRKRA